MTPQQLALRREILLMRIALQRARLQRDLASLHEAVDHALPAALCARVIGGLLRPAAADEAAPAATTGATRWLRWLVIALQVARMVAKRRRRRAKAVFDGHAQDGHAPG